MTLDSRILDLLTPDTRQRDIYALALEGLTNSQIANQLNIKYSSVTSALTKAKQLAAKRGYDPDYDLTHPTADGFFVKGVSTLYGDDGQIKQQWVKTDIDKTQFVEDIKQLVEGLVEDLPQFEPVPYEQSFTSEELMAVYPLGDPHIGVLARKAEVGEDWDLKAAQEVFCGVFERLVKTTPSCEQAVIVNLGDYFHYDSAVEKKTSRSGHHLDGDGNYLEMADTGLKIMLSMINAALDHHKTVRVITTIGNHDDTGAMFLMAALKHMYQFEDRVEIDFTPSVFQYIHFGKCLLGVHHGHTCKADKLPLVMASDESELWGATEHRVWLTGHIHHDSVKEYSGCKVESFRTIASKDNWAHSGGYRSDRDSKALVFHKDYGEVERTTINVSQVLR